MKTIYFVRHAKSSWKESGISDFDRPLNSRGLRDAPFMAKLLADKKVQPDLIISSPTKRAITTAKIFANGLNYHSENICENELVYEAGIGNLTKVINSLDDKFNTVLLFGHNPGLTMVVNYLADKYIDDIPTCGIVKLEFEIEKWKSITDNSGKIIFFEFPKKYFE